MNFLIPILENAQAFGEPLVGLKGWLGVGRERGGGIGS